LQPLPIDPLLPEICRRLAEARCLVLEAPPGAGKTTRVPPALLEALPAGGEIVVSEPRRLAARLAAHRVAAESRERVGERIGYSVRFEDVSGPRTRIRYVTEGVLLRRLLDDPLLESVSAVLIDEVHERHLATDLCLALVHRLRQSSRPDLWLCVMSATIEADAIAEYLGGCPIVRSEGRLFPLTIEHQQRPDDRPLEKQVVSAVRRLITEQPDGHVLVFLPGAAEIRRASDALEPLAGAEGLAVLPLHGDLDLADQARAVEDGTRRKLVLSTNVAESSVTVEGVSAVVDSGMARVAGHSPWTGLPRLELAKVSRASATQRAGRAGRTRPGRVLRLYTRGDFETRPEHDSPEIARSDLSEALLMLYGAGVDARALPFLDAPPEQALAAAERLLERLGAAQNRALTDVGQRMLAMPLHPRLARVLVEGERRGMASEAALAAALLSERDIRAGARTRFGAASALDVLVGDSDVTALADLFEEAEAEGFAAHRVRALGLDSRALRAVERARRQIARVAKNRGRAPESAEEADRALRIAVLAGFCDRVAKRRAPASNELVLMSGGTARLAETSVVQRARLLVAIDVDERRSGRSGALTVRLASAIEPEWLLDLHPDLLEASEELVWDDANERVMRVSRISCESVVLEEDRVPAPPSEQASELLLRMALTRAPGLVSDLEGLAARVAVLRDALPEQNVPPLGEAELRAALVRACAGASSLSELRAVDLAAAVEAGFDDRLRRLLRDEAPERIQLPGGRSLLVHYERDKPPWVESRLQDFFGMSEAPRVGRGRVPLTLHLLAPNQRAVQVTSDLGGFWERHYATIRRELMRRYPRHAWPEDGRSAHPPEPRRGDRQR
jgi:ATP-dependent helicase HrpB